jgi:signal transduction histidine kinase
LCLAHGIKACHSQPVFDQDGRAIASFFVSLAEAREPNAWERHLAEFGAHLAGIVLDRDRTAKALLDSQERLQAAAAELEKRVEERTKDLTRSQADLRALASELNVTEQRERKRLAGELHDHLQQMLVYGKMQLGRGMLKTAADPACMEIIHEVHGMLSKALTYTHTLVAELCPPVLREHGLIAGLRWLADYMKRYGMSVTVTLPDEEDLTLQEDWTILLFQSVRELLMNAHKYAGTGSAELALFYGDGSLTIHVRDRGKGFDSTASADLTVGGHSSKFGLFSIKERMRTLGGSFAIASAPGQGTTATLRLPLASQPTGQACDSVYAEAAAGMAASRRDPVGSRPIRVLLVDDHIMIRQGLRAVLEAYPDIELVGEAGNGEEAVSLVDRLEPSVVIMDISMPKMNGIEATGRITARHPAIAVIGLSVNAEGDNQAAMLKAGARRLLTKEAAVEQLYGAIKSAVGLSA